MHCPISRWRRMPAELSLARDPFRALPVEFPSKGKHLLVRSIHPCDDPSASPQGDGNQQNGGAHRSCGELSPPSWPCPHSDGLVQLIWAARLTRTSKIENSGGLVYAALCEESAIRPFMFVQYSSEGQSQSSSSSFENDVCRPESDLACLVTFFLPACRRAEHSGTGRQLLSQNDSDDDHREICQVGDACGGRGFLSARFGGV